MLKNKFQKLVSLTLSFTLIGLEVPCNGVGLIPVNKNGPVVPPAKVEISQIGAASKVSIESYKSKITDIVSPKKHKSKLQEAYSGDCGDDAKWILNTETGVLTIWGSGRMNDYDGSVDFYCWRYTMTCPWWNYRNYVKSVEIREGITYIGKYSFSALPNDQYCMQHAPLTFENLNSVTIPSSVQEIGATFSTDSITSVTLNNDYSVAHFRECFSGYAKVTTVTLGEGVTEIPKDAFSGCVKLKSITVPASVNSIGKTAFSFCNSLTDFKYLGTNSPTTAANAFDDCSLTGIKVTSKYQDTECCGLPITSITGHCGSNLNWELQPSTGALVVSGSGQMINYTDNSPAPWSTFKSSIKSVNIGYGATSIGNNAFISCDNVASVILPSTLTSIGNSAFSGCENLKTLSLDDGITTIGSNAFSSCKKLSSVNFYGLTEPTNDQTAFSQCDLLVEVTVPITYSKNTFCGIPIAKTIILPGQTLTVPTEASQTSSLALTSTPTYEFTPAKTIILPGQTLTVPTEASQTSSLALTSAPTYEFTHSLDSDDGNGPSSKDTILEIIGGVVALIAAIAGGAAIAIKCRNKCQCIHIEGNGNAVAV